MIIFNSIRRFFIILFVINFTAYSFSDDSIMTSYDYYFKAFDEISNSNFQNATQELEKIQKYHTFSIETKKSIILECFLYYILEEYDKIEAAIDAFKILYPNDLKIRYLIYIQGLSFYKQIIRFDNSKDLMRLAIEKFNFVIDKDSTKNDIYTIKSKEMIIKIYQLIIKNEISIADFYYENDDYISAAKRYGNILKKYEHYICESNKNYIFNKLDQIASYLKN